MLHMKLELFLKADEKHNKDKVYILKSQLLTLFNVILRMMFLGNAAHYSAIFSSMNLILLYI